MDNSTKANRALKPAASACRVASTRLPVRNSGTYGRSAGRTAISSDQAVFVKSTKPPAQQLLSSTPLSDTTVTDAYDVALPVTDSDAATLPVLRSRGSLFLQRSSQAPVKTASPAMQPFPSTIRHILLHHLPL